jgi:hypothetical protein
MVRRTVFIAVTPPGNEMQPLAGNASLAEFVIEQLAGQQCGATTREGSGANAN